MSNTTFSIKIEGLAELIESAKKAGREMPTFLKDQMVRATTDIQNEAKRVAPERFKNQTGNLRRSIFKEVRGAEYGRVYVSSDAPYAEGVEKGTKPHVIRPKNGKHLVFKAGGKTIFAKKVNHPGSKPYPFMEPAFVENEPKIARQYEDIAQKIVELLAK